MSIHFAIRTDKETFSTNDQPDAIIVECKGRHVSNLKEDTIIAVKVPGFHHDFGSLGNKSYIPAAYQVYRVTECNENGLVISGHAELIIDFPVRQN